MACKDKSKEQVEKAKKDCATKKTHYWISDTCSCSKKLISDEQFKKDSTAFVDQGKFDHGNYPINTNLRMKDQPLQTREFLRRVSKK